LPEDIRYKPEFIFPVAIIPGPHEPPLEELNHYIRPIVEEIRAGWKPGYHISNTADFPDNGERVELALLLSINDLPAARKVSGTAGTGAHIYCTVCSCRDRKTMYRTDFEKWTLRDPHVMRQNAEAWRDAETLADRQLIEEEHGVRWSELWQLPYWDPTQMLVVDSMHCILEGLVHYHCRYVLRLDLSVAKSTERTPAFAYPWTPYKNNKKPEFQGLDETERQHITSVHDLLERPLHGDGKYPLDETQLRRRLQEKRKNALKFVADDLELLGMMVRGSDGVYIAPLPSVSPDARPKTCDTDTLRYVQHVIKTTETPSWIQSVPSNYGEASAGIIKAGEWRILSTIYIPLALVTLWADHKTPNQPHFLRILDHSMALFEAVTLMVRTTMTQSRAHRYRLLLRSWANDLHDTHPHTTSHNKRPNVHVAFHIYDFLLLYGPVMSWWTFPFERLIGVLQRINTNDKVGALEKTMLESYSKGANLRRWLRRADCPEVLRHFKALFDKAFSPHVRAESEPRLQTSPLPVEVAHYKHNGINFSRARTHVGNSLVLYYPTPNSINPIAGSIQKITTSTAGVRLHIQRQAPLKEGQRDPFARYPHFPARTYSSEMQKMPRLDVVGFSSVVSHVARYNFGDRAII
ncbi:hypothetical protein CPC08DRAFT_611241, partial [Agrocybe pediades]